MSQQDRRMIPGETKALVPGGYVDFPITRAQDLDLHSILLQINATINVTTAYSGTAPDYAQLLSSFQVIADGDVLQNGTGRFLALGQQYRSTLFSYNGTPINTVGTQTLTHQYAIDFSSVDGLNPKDSILRTGVYGSLVLRVYAPQVGDLFPVGAGAGTFTSLTGTLGYRFSQEYGARSIPFVRTLYSAQGTSLATAQGIPGVEVKLQASGAGTWLKGVFVEVYNSQTRAYLANTITNIAMGQIHDKWIDLPETLMRGWNAYDFETVPRVGQYLVDLIRVSEGMGRLTDARDLTGIAEPRVWLATAGGANIVCDIHAYGFKVARQPA
jgi:hypothetical protein